MKYIALISSILFFSLLSCKNNRDRELNVSDQNTDSTSNEPFYPISQYVQQQIAYVDTTPLAIEKHVYINSRRIDSSVIDRPAFRLIATDFSSPDSNDEKVKPLYTETKFHDLTINTLTFSYSAKDEALPMRQRDILLDPETQWVRTVMFRKVEHRGDTLVTINGLWKHNMNFQLNYLIEPASGPMQTKQIKIIWDRPLPYSNE